MKTVAVASSLLAIVALVSTAVAADSNSTTYPGRCTSSKDCATYSKGLDCIAVDSSTAGLTTLNMCIASDTICSGSFVGRCPTFSSWPSAYRKVMPVCAFTVVDNCNKKISVNTSSTDGSDLGNDAGVGSSSADANTTVECYSVNVTADGESKIVNGIYQCMDARKYISTNGGHLTNLTQSQIVACGGNTSATNPTLCNGQGTCSPKTAFAQEYECKCNSGYTGDKFCATATSNECSNLGQCGTSGTCVLQNATTGSCECKDNATGFQCAACDPSASSVCSGHGTCSSDGSCSCKSGYTGTQCADTASASGQSGPSGGSTDTSSATAVAANWMTTVVVATSATMAVALGVIA